MEDNIEKPDFEQIAEFIVGYRWNAENDPTGDKQKYFIEDYAEGMDKTWNDYVLPLQSRILEQQKRLAEINTLVKEAIKVVNKLKESHQAEISELKEEIERLKSKV